jgi:acetyl-CoA C-acetyltransferase
MKREKMTDTNNPREAVILSAARTPMGRFQGSLMPLTATQLGAAVIRAAVERAGLKDLAEIDEVLMGNVVSAGLGQAPARQAAISAGLPPTVGATTLNKVCGSGLKTGMLASQAIRVGDGDLYVCGGMESMSNAPFLIRARAGELRFGHSTLVDSLLHDGLWDAMEDWAMGMAAEWIADEYDVTRESMDQFACESHEKSIKAIEEGKFKAEITPVEIAGRKGKVIVVEEDETPRADTCMELLAKLRPAFKEDGKVTAGNSSGLNDGAAALVFASRAKAEALGIKPLARVIGYAQAAVPPKELFTAPAVAIPKLLEKVGWSLAEVDLLELNEAFAAQMLGDGHILKDLGWVWDKVNIHGGAVALGHPIGASGARVLTTLIYALKDRSLKRGIASLCLGGGEAVGMAIEME